MVTCELHGEVPITKCSGCSGYAGANRGLGDTVADVLGKIGITETRVRQVVKKPCNCGKRKAKLNELFPYKQSEGDVNRD
jgi:hypothetical protein